MKDIEESLNRALVEQGWIFGDRVTRIGSPFEWSENERKSNILSLRDLMAVGFYFSMYYVSKPTPKAIMIDTYESIAGHCRSTLVQAFRHFFPFLTMDATWANHIEAQAIARTQDYCFLHTYCNDLPDAPNHLDLGPGLGSSAVYSLSLFNSTFYALEANPMSYSVQRNFFRFLSPQPGAYLDVIECENFQLSMPVVVKLMNQKDGLRIKHVPSWRFPHIPGKSMDLVTATFVLNELNHAGILWLLCQVTRTLKPGGYFYIRDSHILKPGMHAIEYDRVLTDQLGFAPVAELTFENRHDFFGIPRVYRKTDDRTWSFDAIVEMCLGKYASVASGGNYAYNLHTLPNKKSS